MSTAVPYWACWAALSVLLFFCGWLVVFVWVAAYLGWGVRWCGETLPCACAIQCRSKDRNGIHRLTQQRLVGGLCLGVYELIQYESL